jgi:methionyl-tRNA formyltransferase
MMTKIVFMGTPEFAVPCLENLLKEGYEVAAVVTQPDRPVGRKRVLTPTPVKAAALEHGIPVWQPEKLRTSTTIEDIRALEPDLIVTAAYGQILPKSVLDIPRFGCINVHGSLLPKYRGGAPIQRSIMNGEPVTGVTIMYMAEGMDTGDMIRPVEVPITDEDNAGTMFQKLSAAGAQLLIDTLPDLIAGRIQAIPQPHEEATYAPNLKREDEKIDWSRSAREIFNQVRGLVPFSGGFTLWNDEVFKVWACEAPSKAEADATKGSQEPGTVLTLSPRGIEVQTGAGTLWLTEVQPAGKKAMAASEFVRGGKMMQGTVLK